MKKLLFLFLLLLISLTPAFAESAVEKAHKTTHRLAFRDGLCSGTAVASNVILTAQHCLAIGSRDIIVDGKPGTIELVIGDSLDHVFLFISGEDIHFADVAEFANDETKVGDDIFYFGNPAGLPDVFRKGYVVAIPEDEPIIAFDVNGFFGDSGAGIFNKDGKLVSVVSAGLTRQAKGQSIKFMIAYVIGFDKETIKSMRD